MERPELLAEVNAPIRCIAADSDSADRLDWKFVCNAARTGAASTSRSISRATTRSSRQTPTFAPGHLRLVEDLARDGRDLGRLVRASQ